LASRFLVTASSAPFPAPVSPVPAICLLLLFRQISGLLHKPVKVAGRGGRFDPAALGLVFFELGVGVFFGKGL